MISQVYIVGAGPGDPDLLTVKALRVLQEADVVIVDRLVSAAILAVIPAGVSRISVGKEAGCHTVTQSDINDMLVKLARAGRKLVRLKGGDPFVFGRGSEEADWLVQNGIPFEVVPGITAAQGCTSALGIPLTHRGIVSGVRFVTGHFAHDKTPELDWQSLADPKTTLVIYMGVATVGLLSARLQEAGLPGATPAAIIENGTTPAQRSALTTLSGLPDTVATQGFRPPALFVIGDVVRFVDRLGTRVPVMTDTPQGSLQKIEKNP